MIRRKSRKTAASKYRYWRYKVDTSM